ncbi:RagB/SusD family nutrient uptake outer membrane protein [Dysgonomonas termitidis]|uniref:RagB/SusD family nutrient uptake outer membrane protein n=1 Tax=Dysgonomonas termitidis TaxID=1516126 RepID=A0ABV9L2F1_9BACT
MKLKTIILFSVFSIFVACDGGLERIEISSDSEKSVFSDKVKTRNALNNLYGSMRHIAGYHSFTENNNQQLLDAVTDNGRNMLWNFPIPTFTQSTLKPGQDVFASGNLPWRDYYKAIRMANAFLANIDSSPVTDEEKADMKIEALFLRALYYCELFKGYGPLVIVGDEISDGQTLEGFERSSVDQTINYIVNEFDQLIPRMKWEWENDGDYGRATKGMAMAYKARMLLYYASPLYTQGVSESDIKSRWKAASDAANALIVENKYDLHPNYVEFFNTRKTEENILPYLRVIGTQAYTMSLSSEFAGGNVCGMRPTFNMIDAYAMKDGKQPVLGYENGEPVFNQQVTNYDDEQFWLNRDPRMEMQIFRHGDQILVNGSRQTINMRIYDEPSPSGQNGFLVKKYINPNHDFRQSGGIHQNVQMMRFAEVLLIFAEAENQANGPSAAVIRAVNRVRNRVKADLLDEADDPYGRAWTKTSLNNQIMLERRMEFFAEEHRFWDARRWKLGHEILGATVYGGFVNENGKYSRYFIENRKFMDKMYLLPLPNIEVNKSEGKIWQNPGW